MLAALADALLACASMLDALARTEEIDAEDAEASMNVDADVDVMLAR